MQTVDLKLDVPVGYSLEEFVAKVNAVIALGGAFAASNTNDWKKEKEEYLDEKYGV